MGAKFDPLLGALRTTDTSVSQATFNTSGKVKQTVYNVKDYGAVGDTQLIVDGAITNGAATLTSTTGKFTSSDVGKVVTVKGAGAAGARLNTTIQTFNSATSVTLSANASTTVTGAHVIWGTDDYAAIVSAQTAALPAGSLFFPPGGYGLSQSLVFSPAQSATKSCVVPSILADSVPGRIGDGGTSSFLDEVDAVAFYPLGNFPQGKFLIDYVSLDNVQSLNGAEIRGLGLICESIAAGMRISNTRRFHVKDIGIDHAALPTGYSDTSATGGFNALQQGGTSTAYNVYENICVGYSAGDGFVHNAAGDDVFLNCYEINSTNTAYVAHGFGRFIACHYEAASIGFDVVCGSKPNIFMACEFFGVPFNNAVRISAGANYIPAQFIGCNFENNPNVGVSEQNGALINVIGGNAVVAKFMGCLVRAGTRSTDFVYVASSVPAGSSIAFEGCDFSGTPTTHLYNDVSGNNVLSFWQCDNISNLVRSGTSTFAASTTSGAAINIPSGTSPTSPNDGDVWFDGSHLQFRNGSMTNQLDQQGGGTVTTTSIVSANGLAGTVSNPTTTPAITLSTIITGLLKGNGTAISAAAANTDYLPVANPTATGTLTTGNIILGTAGNKISITTGSNASAGTGTLVGGTATISTTAVTASSLIFVTDTSSSLTNVGSLTANTIVAGTSFKVTSTNVLDVSPFNWLVIN